MSRAAKLARGLGDLVLLAALVGGVPWALWHYVGWPLPRGIPSWSQLATALTTHGIPDMVLLKALACVVWLCWALLVASLVTEVPAALRGRSARRVAGPFQPLVGHLLAAVVVAALALAPRNAVASTRLTSASAGLVATRPPAAVVVAASPRFPTLRGEPTTTTAKVATRPPKLGPPREYVVQRHDTLWGIAQRELGDPLRWKEIYELNQGRAEPGGRTLDNPHWIYPDWVLRIPGSPSSEPVHERSTTAPTPTSTTTTTVPLTTTTTSTPTTTTTVPAPGPTAPHEPAEPRHRRHPHDAATPPVVQLPSGSAVAGSFAAGVLSAVAIGRLRRRHAYRPSPPAPVRDLGRSPLGPTLRQLASGMADDEDAEDAEPGEPTGPVMAVDVQDGRERPDFVEAGTTDKGEPISLDLSGLGGLALIGPGADDVARALLTGLLARAGPGGAEVLMTRAARSHLLPSAEGTGPAGLTVLEDARSLARVLETEALSRSRQLDEAGVPDACTYRRAHPYEPFPALMAVLDDMAADEAARTGPTLASGARLGLGGLLLGHGNSEARVELGEGRKVVAARPGHLSQLLDGATLFGLGAKEAAEVLAALADAEDRPGDYEDAPDNAATSPPVLPEQPQPWPAPVPTSAAKRVMVRALGPYRVELLGEPLTKGLRAECKELLAWYLVRPEGVSIEETVEELWPGTEPAEVHKKFWRTASSLRGCFYPDKQDRTKLFVADGAVYRMRADDISSDLWDFEAALVDAHKAADETCERDALRRATEAYGGDFVAGTDYRWSEPVRQDLHRRALDALLRLAELEERLGDGWRSEDALRRAVDLDRYAEEPYRRLMKLQAGQSRTESVHETWRLLQRRLAELDIEVEPATVRLYRSLTTPPASGPEPPKARVSSPPPGTTQKGRPVRPG